jgi:DNA-directed RNA polymerase subunit beta'
VAGKVEDIRLAPQGGHFVYVEDASGHRHEHHVQTGREVVVKNGDKVEPGDPLSDGNFKPQELAQFKGILPAQQYVVDQIRKSYAEAGAVVRKPVIEVLAAGLMRTVEITDDSGEKDLAVGDVIHENEYEARKKKNPKLKAKPVILGLSQKPLQSRDLLERLNFQRLDDAIRDVPSSAGQSDLTGGTSPIPGLAYGATFRQEPLKDDQFDRSP